MELPFSHQSISVFSGFDRFQAINPVVKALTLICDDGGILMDSGLILDYAEAHPTKRRSLLPVSLAALQKDLLVIGLAQAASEKSVQIVYEQKLRPADKLYPAWLERISGQLKAAYDALETEFAERPLQLSSEQLDQASLSTAVSWYFTRSMLPDLLSEADYPRLAALSHAAEMLPEFVAAPFGSGTCKPR